MERWWDTDNKTGKCAMNASDMTNEYSFDIVSSKKKKVRTIYEEMDV